MPRPKQDDLPGMEDKQIKPLHEAALDYAGIRDKRMKLSQEESEFKAHVLGLMKKHGKEHYKYNGVEIDILHEEETVKVRVKQDGAESEDESGSEAKQFQAFFADGSEATIKAGSLKAAKALAKKQAAQSGTTLDGAVRHLERVEEAAE